MSETFERTHTITRDGVEVEVTVEIAVDSWGSAPVTSGPPEFCDPGDGLECSVNKAWRTDTGEPVALTDDERERFEIAFAEDPPEADYPDYDDFDR